MPVKTLRSLQTRGPAGKGALPPQPKGDIEQRYSLVLQSTAMNSLNNTSFLLTRGSVRYIATPSGLVVGFVVYLNFGRKGCRGRA
jgi:hypothetical protein